MPEVATSLPKNLGRFFLDILPDWIKTPFKAALGIASSKVFAGYGRYTMEGYIVGLDSMHSKVEDAILGATTFNPSQHAVDALANVPSVAQNSYATRAGGLAANTSQPNVTINQDITTHQTDPRIQARQGAREAQRAVAAT